MYLSINSYNKIIDAIDNNKNEELDKNLKTKAIKLREKLIIIT
jgi:hypothetical protein